MTASTTTLDRLNETTREEFVSTLSPLFEGPPFPAERAWGDRPFGSAGELQEALCRALFEADEEEQLSVVRAHPELAGERLRAGKVSESSRSEQAGAGLDRLTEEEAERFDRMNREYRERFGFPFVICVKNHSKDEVLAELSRRIEGTREEEISRAVREACEISHLRLVDLLEEPS